MITDDMKRRDFLKAIGCLPLMGMASTKAKETSRLDVKLAESEIKPFHAGLARTTNGTFYPEYLQCWCSHRIYPHWAMQDEEILGCSECGRRVQIHIFEGELRNIPLDTKDQQNERMKYRIASL